MGVRSTSVHHNRKNSFWRILDFALGCLCEGNFLLNNLNFGGRKVRFEVQIHVLVVCHLSK